MDSERLSGLPCCRRFCRQKVTVSRGSLTPFVRISPMGHGGTPRNVCAFSETSIRSATATSENFSLSPCSGLPWLYKDFIARSVTRCPGFAALGIDCDRLTSCVVILSQTMLVVPFCTIFLLSHWGFIFIADYVAVRFHRPGFDAPDYCPINQRFQLACLMKRAAPEIFLLLWNEKSPQLPAVGSIFNPKAEHLLFAPHALWMSSKRNRW